MMYKPFTVYYYGNNKLIKLAECNTLESARRFVKKRSGGEDCTYPWDGSSEGYGRYIIDKGNII